MYLTMGWKSTAMISGAGLLATWFFSMPQLQPATAVAPSSAVPVTQVPAAAIDIQREAARLQVRLHPESGAVTTSRNPFRFGAAPRVTSTPVEVTAAPIVALPIVQAPQFSLDGIATDTVDGQEQRTAILHTDAGVVMVHAGDVLVGQYKVVSIAQDSIELVKTSDGSTTRLGLR